MSDKIDLEKELIENYEFHRGKEQGRIAEYHRIMGILIGLEKKILKEDKTGCTRDMMVEGTFTRIREAIYQEVV